jgi:fructokinase
MELVRDEQPPPPEAMAAAADDRTEQQEPSKVVCFGELLVDFVPTVGGLSVFEEPCFKAGAGGAPANVAVGICKLGIPAAFIGKVGDDEFGHALANVLKEHGVETRGVRFDAHAPTGLAFISLRSDGERTFIFYRNPSADMLMVPEELDRDLITNAKIFHYGSISLIAEPSRSTHLEAIKIAKEAGVLLSYDPNLRLQLWPSPEEARKQIMSIWSESNIIKVSADEVRFLIATSTTAYFASSEATDNNNKAFKVEYEEVELLTSSFDHDAKSWRPNLKLLLVTDGPHGCHYFTPRFKGTVATLKVQVVDTTGAGDAFVAGILTKLVQDVSLLEDEKRLREAVRFANACGAITVTRRGAIPALPDYETVLNLLRELAITD